MNNIRHTWFGIAKLLLKTVLRLLFLAGLLLLVPLCFLIPPLLPVDFWLSYAVTVPLAALTAYVTKKVLFNEIAASKVTMGLVGTYLCLYASLIALSPRINFAVKYGGLAEVKSILRSARSHRLEPDYNAVGLTRDVLSNVFFDVIPLNSSRCNTLRGFKVREFHPEEYYLLVHEIFVNRCYFFESRTERPFILDCGSNIGMSVLYFKHLYPECSIVAFEPDGRTCGILRENIDENRLQDVQVVEKALSDREGYIRFETTDGYSVRSGTFRTGSNRSIEVPTVRLSSYINGPVDFVKIDVEGAEGAIIKDLVESKKIAYVQQMIVEFHHNMENQAMSLGEFLQVLDQNGFDYAISAPTQLPVVRGSFQDILVFAYQRN